MTVERGKRGGGAMAGDVGNFSNLSGAACYGYEINYTKSVIVY